MSPQEFCYWLQGVFEVADPKQLDERQTAMLKEHLRLVFTKVTPEPAKAAPPPQVVPQIVPMPYPVIEPVIRTEPPRTGLPWDWWRQPQITCSTEGPAAGETHTLTFCGSTSDSLTGLASGAYLARDMAGATFTTAVLS